MPVKLKRKRRGTDNLTLKKTQVTERPVGEVYRSDNIPPGQDPNEDEDEADEKTRSSVGGSGNAQKRPSKLPSASELRAINEARDLYKNHVFRAQLDLLLAEIRPKASCIPPLQRTLQRLHAHLTSLPSIPAVHPLEAAHAFPRLLSSKSIERQADSVASSVAIPYPTPIPPRSTAWKVAFEPPEAMNVVGSWSDGLAVRKPDGAPFGVDLVVEMPAKLFQEKDYRNSRFFYKRAFYLSCLAVSIAHSSLNLNVEYEAASGDVRATTLLLSPRQDGTKHDFSQLHAAIRVIPVLSDAAPIPLNRLSPAQSNIHGSTLPPATSSQPETEQSPSDSSSPTPRYNNTLALSFARPSRSRLIAAHKLANEVPSFADALALLRIWANQRGYGSGSPLGGEAGKNYCVYGFEGLGAWWACVLEVLIVGEEPVERGDGSKGKPNTRPLVGKGLSSYQLFRAGLDFLAKRNFETEPLFMKVVEHGQKFNPVEWMAHYEAVFVDATGTVNMLAGVPAVSLQLLRQDAASTLHTLAAADDAFNQAFLKDLREPHTRFDTVIRINPERLLRQPKSLDFHSPQAAILHDLVLTVRKALTTRALVVVPLLPRSLPHSITTARPSSLSVLTLGILFDPVHATRLVDHGPAANTPEVAAFRAFWGPKAELRRFKDGSIVESCVWDEGIVRVEDREGVPPRIVRFILDLHCGLSGEDVCVLGGDYGRVVVAPALGDRREGAYKDALAAFDRFSKELRELEEEGDLPLRLVSVKPCSPSLRHTSVFPPSPVPTTSNPVHPSISYLPAFEVVLQLESSSQWPDDLRAIQKVKLALFESMSRGLLRRGACRARVLVDRNATDIEDGCAIEVVLDGWAFYARVGYDREVTLLQELMADEVKRPGPPAAPAPEREAATRGLSVYRRRFLHAPSHHNAVLALHHKFPSYSYAVRLVKRWLGSHWLSARVTDEAVELICAHVYFLDVNDVPASGKRGFFRVVNFLKSWDGAAYVPLYERAREDDTTAHGEHVVQAGKSRWRLMTAEDVGGTVWCEDVTIPVAMRIREVARATMLCLEQATPTVMPLFAHPTTDYDFLIELQPHAVTRYWESMDSDPSVWNASTYPNLTSNSTVEPVRVAFNPAVMLFHDLQRVYGDTMELFYDSFGGATIGGVWNPSIVASDRHSWRVFLGFSSIPLSLSPQAKKMKPDVAFNAEGVLSEIRRLGEGIIKTVTVRQ